MMWPIPGPGFLVSYVVRGTSCQREITLLNNWKGVLIDMFRMRPKTVQKHANYVWMSFIFINILKHSEVIHCIIMILSNICLALETKRSMVKFLETLQDKFLLHNICLKEICIMRFCFVLIVLNINEQFSFVLRCKTISNVII